MTKQIVSEKELLRKINEALALKWKIDECEVHVESLKNAHVSNRNWQVGDRRVSGKNLQHCEAFDTLLESILGELSEGYDVEWNQD